MADDAEEDLAGGVDDVADLTGARSPRPGDDDAGQDGDEQDLEQVAAGEGSRKLFGISAMMWATVLSLAAAVA